MVSRRSPEPTPSTIIIMSQCVQQKIVFFILFRRQSLVILIFKKCRRFLLLGFSFQFACIFIGNLISLFLLLLALHLAMFHSQEKVESGKMFMQSLCFFGSAGRSKKGRRKTSKFIKYKFIRVSRKKEINFHKFESQIKLREAQKESRGSCAV